MNEHHLVERLTEERDDVASRLLRALRDRDDDREYMADLEDEVRSLRAELRRVRLQTGLREPV